MKTFLLASALFFSLFSYSQFSTPNIDGSIGTNEYGVHTDGNNQISNSGTWFMTWNNTTLFLATSGSNIYEPAVIYLDLNPLATVNGGTNSNGNLNGFNNYDRCTYNAPFRADVVIFFKGDYAEYRTANGSGGWSGNTVITSRSGSGSVLEISLTWNSINNNNGMPSAFNFYGFKIWNNADNNNGIYSQIPSSNPGGAQNQSAYTLTATRYFTVSNTADGNATKPFSQISYATNSGSASLSGSFFDFTLNSSTATLNGATSVSNCLNVTGSGTLNTGNNLTLTSTATRTARVAAITGSISGDVTVERYIPASGKRAWRLLSAPLSATGAPTIYNAWQEGGVNTNTGYGTHITQAGGAGTNGFDASTTANASSIRYYDATNNVLLTPANTNTTKVTDNGGAYFLFVRGSRNGVDINNSASSSNTTLRMKGGLNVGNVTAGVAGSSFSLIPNPYASPVDFEAVRNGNGSNIDVFYVYDATLKNYRTIEREDNTPTYSQTPSGGSPETDNSARYILSGQSYFLAGNKTINYTESMKSDALPVNNAYKTSTTEQKMLVNLMVNAGGTYTLIDGVRARFNSSFSKQVISTEDVVKMPGFAENLGILRDNQTLAIEKRPIISSNDTIFLRLWNTATASYQFEFNPTNIDAASMTAFLQDSYTGTSTPLNLTSVSTLNFTVDASIAASKAEDRFRIVFVPSSTLPSGFVNVKAAQKGTEVLVEWAMANENDIKDYTVERSSNGVLFAPASLIKAKGNNHLTTAYNWTDANPENGNNYYRIRATGLNNNVQYSQIIKIKTGADIKPEITTYPNPVKGNMLNLSMNNISRGDYQVQIFDQSGRQVFGSVINHAGGSASRTVTIPVLAKGIYQLKITNGEQVYVHKLMAE